MTLFKPVLIFPLALAACVEAGGAPMAGPAPVFRPYYMDAADFQRQTTQQAPIPVYSSTTCRPIYGGGFQCM